MDGELLVWNNKRCVCCRRAAVGCSRMGDRRCWLTAQLAHPVPASFHPLTSSCTSPHAAAAASKCLVLAASQTIMCLLHSHPRPALHPTPLAGAALRRLAACGPPFLLPTAAWGAWTASPATISMMRSTLRVWPCLVFWGAALRCAALGRREKDLICIQVEVAGGAVGRLQLRCQLRCASTPLPFWQNALQPLSPSCAADPDWEEPFVQVSNCSFGGSSWRSLLWPRRSQRRSHRAVTG